MTRLQIVVASRHGGTAGIAERIAEVLRAEGIAATVARAEDRPPVAGFDAHLVGSGVYMGSWLKEATESFTAGRINITEFENAAMIDGYSRMQAFWRVVLPQATTGIAATSIFCLIFAWNEYAFAALLTSGTAQTAPPFIPTIIGEGGQDWPAVAAGTTIFLIPILVFTVLLRKQLLRGITFGAVRK